MPTVTIYRMGSPVHVFPSGQSAISMEKRMQKRASVGGNPKVLRGAISPLENVGLIAVGLWMVWP